MARRQDLVIAGGSTGGRHALAFRPGRHKGPRLTCRVCLTGRGGIREGSESVFYSSAGRARIDHAHHGPGIANINLAVANVALPDIGKAFQASQTALDLIAVGYSLGQAASVLYLGALGDRYWRKLLLVLGIGLSVPASLLAAFAPSIGAIMQSIFGALLTAGYAAAVSPTQ